MTEVPGCESNKLKIDDLKFEGKVCNFFEAV